MSKLCVLGLGNFGTSLVKVWLQAGNEVTGWTVEEDVYQDIVSNQRNEKYLKGELLTGLTASMNLGEAVANAEIIVLALPSGVVLKVVDDLLQHLQPEQILLDLAKGLAPGERLVSDVITERVENAGLKNPVAILTGPTIAPEVAAGVLTTALISSHDETVSQKLVTALTTDTFRLQGGEDPVGAELWGAFKNVIALACGIVDGLKEGGGDNLKAALFSAGYREGCRLLPVLGAQPETSLGPAGIGDLFVTAISPHGRNRSMGEKLGQGLSLEEALGEMVMVSEGVRAARMFKERGVDVGVELPFVAALNRLLDGNLAVSDCVAEMVGLS